MVLKWLRRMRLSARGDSRRHVGSAGHSLGFHEFPLFLCAGKSLLSKPTRKESPVRWGLFLFAKTSLSPSTLFSCAPPPPTQKLPRCKFASHPSHTTQKNGTHRRGENIAVCALFLLAYQKYYIIKTSDTFNRTW